MADKPDHLSLEIEVEPHVKFLWLINESPNRNWNSRSPILNCHKLFPEKCSLVMNWTYANDGYNIYYNVNLEIQFVERQSNFKGTMFNITLYFNSNLDKGYTFNLQETSTNSKIASETFSIFNTSFSIIENVKVSISCNTSTDVLRTLTIPFVNMSKDIKQLLETEKHCDFKMIVQDQVFNVHKAILSSRCTVLAKMIESNMLERKKGELQFNNFDPIVVKELLSFIYTTEYNVAKRPHELFKIAHYLELKELQVGCKQFLLENINHKNIVNTMELTDEEQYDLEDLRKAANNFIKNEEKQMSQDPDYIEYLCRSISISNVFFVFKFANTYNLEEPLQCAMEFVKFNYKAVLENSKCKDFFLKHADLFIKINTYCFDAFAFELNELKKD